MHRRNFISLLGGAAAWPLAAGAQQRERVRRIGVLMSQAPDDPDAQPRLTVFVQGLQQLGWTVGSNMQIEYRWGAGDSERGRKGAAELIALNPEVIFASGGASSAALHQATRTVPIVFTNAIDPVGGGLVESLARPGGNVTGFTAYEYGISGKWLELLKEIAPHVKRVGVMRILSVSGGAQLGAIQGAAPRLGVEVTPIGMSNVGEFERGIAAFARQPNGGLIVTGSGFAQLHHDRIIALAGQYRLPAVYAFRYYVIAGGLISYGPKVIDQYREAAGYVDRILRGEKPADLPVQTPTKYETVLNMKAAKALGVDVPDKLLATADEVIE
jgi:putative ABC transport system substrate-binding protein